MIDPISPSDFFSNSDKDGAGLLLRCPRCLANIGRLPDRHPDECATAVCPNCSWKLQCEDGIWKTLLPDRISYFSRFMQDYESIRAAEGRGSEDSEFYFHLPYQDISGRNHTQWAIRSRTFRHIEKRILPNLFGTKTGKLRILDLGAGNGWMSYRFALQGHSSVAVDLLVNNQDGLGAAAHYRKRLSYLFPRFQAELDKLPFAARQFDLVIFNASFHYSEDYERSLAEAIRCTRAGGVVLIADTPWYSKHESGQMMLEERRAAFTARFGIASDAINSLEYLTDDRLRKLEDTCGIRWQTDTPFYGIRWTLRPFLASLNGKREPSRFRIYAARNIQ